MKSKILFIILVFLIFINSSQAQENLSHKAIEAKNSLEDINLYMEQMKIAGFNTTRIRDIKIEANQLFNAELSIENETTEADYSRVLAKVELAKKIKEKAFETSGELEALEKQINESTINKTEPLKFYNEAKNEFYNERYEQAIVQIDNAYKKIYELEAETTRTHALYKASMSIGRKILLRWKEIIATLAISALIIFLFYDKAYAYMINRKIAKLKIRRAVLDDLIKKTQYIYFEKGKISETEYHIKMDKFSELIRDINRQLPLLRKQLEFIKGPLYRLGLKKETK